MDATDICKETALDEVCKVHYLVSDDVRCEVEVRPVAFVSLVVVMTVDVHTPVESLYRLVREDELLGDEQGTGVYLVEVLTQFLHANIMVSGNEYLMGALVRLPDGIPHFKASHITEMDDGIIPMYPFANRLDMLFDGNPVGIHELAVEVMEVGIADDIDGATIGPRLEHVIELLNHFVFPF